MPQGGGEKEMKHTLAFHAEGKNLLQISFEAFFHLLETGLRIWQFSKQTWRKRLSFGNLNAFWLAITTATLQPQKGLYLNENSSSPNPILYLTGLFLKRQI